MPNIPTRLILFLSSYAPLFLIIAMRGWRDSRHLAVGMAIVAVLSVAVLFAFLQTAQKLYLTR
jgi:hypothetical protein